MAIMMEPQQMAPWLRDLNRLFGAESGPAPFAPPADILVSQDQVMVYMDVPGLRPDDIEVELEQDMLTVRGERKFPYQDTEQRVWRRIERSFGRFERALRVPAGLNPDQVRASLADGVLMLTIPQPQPPQPKRVQISGAEASGAQQPQQHPGGQASQQQQQTTPA
jgi:HSP20 family protein